MEKALSNLGYITTYGDMQRYIGICRIWSWDLPSPKKKGLIW